MTEETTTKETTTKTPATGEKKTFSGRGGQKGGKRPFKRRPRQERPKPEFDQKIMNIRRVTRVMAGGRRFSFSVAMVIGDKKGSVGVGVGKAGDTSLAIQKAVNNAKKNMVTLNLTEDNSLAHEVNAKFNSARVMMMPNGGRGLVAGSAIRNVLELAGVRDVTGKAMSRTKNQINIARATIKALAPFSRPYVKKVAKKDDAQSEKASSATQQS
jgi:small subunit ribosomal protein S5